MKVVSLQGNLVCKPTNISTSLLKHPKIKVRSNQMVINEVMEDFFCIMPGTLPSQVFKLSRKIHKL